MFLNFIKKTRPGSHSFFAQQIAKHHTILPHTSPRSKFEIYATLANYAVRAVGFENEVSVVSDDTIHSIRGNYSLNDDKLTLRINPEMPIDNLRTLYAGIGCEALYAENVHKKIQVGLSLPFLMCTFIDIGLVSSIVLSSLVIFPLVIKGHERDADLTAVKRLKTHDAFCEFLSVSQTMNAEKTKPLCLKNGLNDQVRLALIHQQKDTKDENNFFQTTEFKTLEDELDALKTHSNFELSQSNCI